MAAKHTKLLIIEDHKIIAQAYETIINTIEEFDFNISFAHNCDDAVKQINTSKNRIAILDLQLPISENERFICGEDLGLLIREKSPNTKILILTSITDQARVLSIISEINPEGFMIKSDIESKDLKTAIVNILNGKKSYSKTIQALSNTTTVNGLTIDDFDRQILYHLSMGEKTKDLTKFIPLSTRAIEVRKTKLKTLLDSEDNGTFNLVKSAKKLGYV
ncbi:response regulator [Seonamhaeicola marinus]|uniref:Response regulator transcription factor n=1 Tax=Seonamhaeicola marinus TaxID=1912246 RepID=A0A5D0IMB3_9FLAO|nr:response regulator [Seonamhaeicola marinus]TYA84151.1 response regulator transcription factor [Seonamhaeicola marinus]